MEYYYSIYLFFFGFFAAQIPNTDDKHWLVLPALIVICFVAALLFPLAIIALYIARKKVSRTVRITEKVLEKLEFERIDLGDETPYEMWLKHGINIWNYNDEYWLVDILDQAGIRREFRTTIELAEFFKGCGLSLYT